MSEIAVRVDHVSKSFRLYKERNQTLKAAIMRGRTSVHEDFWALKDVAFDVPVGSTFGLIGSNGSGKLTLLKCLANIYYPTKGKITHFGRIAAMLEVGSGFHSELSGRENVFLNGSILGMSKKEITRKFDEIVEFSGLAEFIDTPVKRYSSGMFARLGFAVAAHVDPDVLIVDEVLSVGDYLFQRKCMERMAVVLKGGATVIFVSHNLRAVTDLCSRALLLSHGHLLADGPSTEVLQKYMQAGMDASTNGDRPVYLSRFALKDRSGDQVRFESGAPARIEVEISARQRVERLSLVLMIYDDNQYQLFSASTERMGAPPFTLDPGQKISYAFDLQMHLAPGTYRVAAALYRYDVQREYGTFQGTSFFVHSKDDIRGAVNLYPKLTTL